VKFEDQILSKNLMVRANSKSIESFKLNKLSLALGIQRDDEQHHQLDLDATSTPTSSNNSSRPGSSAS